MSGTSVSRLLSRWGHILPSRPEDLPAAHWRTVILGGRLLGLAPCPPGGADIWVSAAEHGRGPCRSALHACKQTLDRKCQHRFPLCLTLPLHRGLRGGL